MVFGLRELRDKDLPQLTELVKNASVYSTVRLRDSVRDFGTFPGWWFGSLRDGTELESFMAIHDHSAEMYTTTTDAVEAMAVHLKKTQAYTAANTSHRHQIRGVRGVIDPFWKIFKDLGRQLVSDVESSLMASTAAGTCASKRIAMGFAKPEDLGTLVEFSALRLLEEKGTDPRRQGLGVLAERCRGLIAEGRVVVGREAGKPVFLAVLRPVSASIVLLDEVYIPAAFRTRKRLIGGALYKLKFAPPVRERELLFFADSEALRVAAQTAGYEEKAAYRTIVTVG